MGPVGIEKIRQVFDGRIDIELVNSNSNPNKFVRLIFPLGIRDKANIDSVMRPLVEAGLAYKSSTHDGHPIPEPITNPEDPLLTLGAAREDMGSINIMCEDVHSETSL